MGEISFAYSLDLFSFVGIVQNLFITPNIFIISSLSWDDLSLPDSDIFYDFYNMTVLTSWRFHGPGWHLHRFLLFKIQAHAQTHCWTDDQAGTDYSEDQHHPGVYTNSYRNMNQSQTYIIIRSIVLKSWSVIFVYRNLYCLSLVESRWVLHQHRWCRWRPSLQPRSADPVMDSWGRNHRMGHMKTNTSQTQWSLCLRLVLPATPLNTAMIDLTVECSFRARPATSCY